MPDLSGRLEVFQELLDCIGNINFWVFDGNGLLISTNSACSDLYSYLFSHGECKEMLLKNSENETTPMFISDTFSITWFAVPRKADDGAMTLYVVGPVLPSAISEQGLRKLVNEIHFSSVRKETLFSQLRSIPIFSYQSLFQYAIMLYRCIYKETLTVADVRLLSHRADPSDESGPVTQGEAGYVIQQEILQAVEDGNIGYIHPQPAMSIHVRSLSVDGPLRQAKYMMLVYISLIVRAAIRGGLPMDTAFTISETYVLASESCSSVTDVYQNALNALKDFTKRVHDIKYQGYSKPVRECAAYLYLHIREPFSLENMAVSIGYNKNYIGAKFKEETGKTPGQFLMAAKLKMAAVWLKSSKKSVQDICHDLGFESVSYFGVQFKKAYGCSPGQYRNQSA